MKDSILNRTVSGFASVKHTEPKAVNLLTWLQTDKYRQQVEAVRAATSKEERTALKQHLPAITVSGLFKQRNQAGLTKHSGLLCLDIDRQDNGHISNFADLKTELAKIQNMAFVGLSVSGKGYFCIVPISQPDHHQRHFQAICYDLRQYGIICDQSGSDITRLRFASYDKEPYFNHQATVYEKLYTEPQRVQTMQRAQTVQPCKTPFEALLRKITETGTDITRGYKNWFEIGAGLASEFGENGRSYYHQLSQWHKDYKPTETDRQFNHCLRHRNNYTINTIFYQAKQFGIFLKQN
jgi:hypothetical protein